MKGLMTFYPVPEPPLPEPWASGTQDQINRYINDPTLGFGNLEQLQMVENREAIHSGNLGAVAHVGAYNGWVKLYWNNGGPDNKYGFKLPELPELTQYYKPAVDARVKTRAANDPTGIVLETPIWSLPPGTVLYTVAT
jgi:hypothetical protein